jgi:hypothetical protein
MNRFFTYSGAAPRFSATDFDYDALCAELRRPLDKQKVFEALRIFIFENWGKPPTSNSVVKSLLRIEKASKNAVPALEKLFSAFSTANSEAHAELGAAIPLRMEDFPDYHDFGKLAKRLPLIARAAGTAARNVPKLQRGRPGKGEFSGLVLRLHKAFEAAGGKGWITFKPDYDVQSDSDTYTVGGLSCRSYVTQLGRSNPSSAAHRSSTCCRRASMSILTASQSVRGTPSRRRLAP